MFERDVYYDFMPNDRKYICICMKCERYTTRYSKPLAFTIFDKDAVLEEIKQRPTTIRRLNNIFVVKQVLYPKSLFDPNLMGIMVEMIFKCGDVEVQYD
jgi:hypothetical protein